MQTYNNVFLGDLHKHLMEKFLAYNNVFFCICLFTSQNMFYINNK